MRFHFFIAVIAWPLFANQVSAQTRLIDSLRKRVYSTAPDQERLDCIRRMLDQSISADSLLPYVEIAGQIARRTGSGEHSRIAAFARAAYFIRKNDTDSALGIVNALLAERGLKEDNPSFHLELLFFKSKIYDRANQYTLALGQLMEVIEQAESLKDTATLVQARTGIGWVQMEMAQYREALRWFYLARNTSRNKDFYRNYGALYSNMANAFNAIGQADSARHYIQIAIDDARANDNLTFLATALSIQARIFIANNESRRAEGPLHEALEIRKRMNDPFYIVYDMSNLASYYANNGQWKKGVELCMQGIELARQSGLSSQLLLIYEALAQNYKAAGNDAEYARALESVIGLKDSFNNINSSKLLSDLQAGIEAQKQQQEIAEQRLSIARRNYWLYASGVFGCMAIAIAWLAFNSYRRKQAAKMQVSIREEKRRAAQAIIDAEESERKRIAADLHDNLGAYAASIAANIDNIRITAAEPANAIAIQELRKNAQSIVSQLNDTIWVLKKDALSLTAISDRLKVFIQRIQSSYPNIKIDVVEAIENDQLLAPSQAFHLFQVMKEAINNAVRHSAGSQVNVIFHSQDRWEVIIEDNGRGITDSAFLTDGNGLTNMRNRCREASWDIRWDSNQPSGTRLIIASTTN